MSFASRLMSVTPALVFAGGFGFSAWSSLGFQPALASGLQGQAISDAALPEKATKPTQHQIGDQQITGDIGSKTPYVLGEGLTIPQPQINPERRFDAELPGNLDRESLEFQFQENG